MKIDFFYLRSWLSQSTIIKKKEDKTLTEEDEQAVNGWFTKLISNLRTKVVNAKTLRQFLNKIVKKILDNQLIQKEILFMRFNLIIH